ncbi:MAG TPA: fasciclin domain-containing protein [Steroidobacteraceae bacterium]|nr:fasciclin domain-containing protein [Steroidobacteraceae bacterium]
MKTLIDTAAEAGKFASLLNALRAAALTETLRGPGPYTLFAPTDKAFQKLPPGSLNALLKDRRKLRGILEYHLVSGAIAGKDINAGQLTTVEGGPLIVAIDGVRITVNDARVMETDIDATNGVIHVIDTLMLPTGVVLAAAA